jgi:iron(III) transport system substrate-binding protein
MGRRTTLAIFTGLLAFGLAACGGESPQSTTQPAAPLSADDMDALVAAAQAEGTVSFYTSLPVEPTTRITDAFTAKYGIPVEMYRAESTQLLQRAVNEARAGRYAVDVIESAAAEVEAMEREQLFRELDLPIFDDLVEGAVVPGRAWVATRLTLFGVAYNTNLVPESEVPHSYRELLDPKWKGMIGIEGENANWLMEISGINGREETINLFGEIVATNGMSVRRGHTLLVTLVASGEVPIGINAYHEHVEQAKDRGAPVEYVIMEPAIAMPLSAGVFRQAPHPNAALLFMNFLLSDAQALIVEQYMIPTNRNYSSQAGEPNFKLLDVAKYVDEHDEWLQLYLDLFSGR